MGKEVKTNVVRILEKYKVPYKILTYECDHFIDGIETAKMNGVPVEQSYKTLVLRGKSNQSYVFVLPVEGQVDMKCAAKLVGEKSLEMLPVKEIANVTGYVRGGCSPIGMKKAFRTLVYKGSLEYALIYISGGKIGVTIGLDPLDLKKIIDVEFADFIINETK